MTSLKKKFWRWNRIRAIAVLSNLVTEDGTRNIVIQQMLVSQTRRNPALWVFRGKWNKFLERLSETGLVRRSLTTGTTYHYELTSEFLIPQIQRWQQNLRMWRQLIVVGIAAILIAIPWSLYNRAKIAEQLATEEKNQAEAATKRATDALDKVEKANAAAESSARKATNTRNEAEKVMVFMLFDLPEKLSPIGRLDLLDEVNRRTLEYYLSHSNDQNARRGYSAALRNKADILYGRGDLPESLVIYKEALDIIQKVAKQNPTNLDLQHDLYQNEDKIAQVLWNQGKFDDAANYCSDSLAISRELAKKDPGNMKWQVDLSNSYDSLGDNLLAQGQDDEARSLFERSIEIAKGVVDRDPRNSLARYRMAEGLTRLADVLYTQGNEAEGLRQDKQALPLIEKLVEEEPGNTNWQRNLAMIYGRVGDTLAARDKAEALKMFLNALKNFQRLAVQDPTNADWQYQLVYLYYEAAIVTKKMGSGAKVEARAFVEKGKEIKRKLETRLTPSQRMHLKVFEEQLP
jgi:tetratricopeptide (TPR) repeat protein